MCTSGPKDKTEQLEKEDRDPRLKYGPRRKDKMQMAERKAGSALGSEASWLHKVSWFATICSRRVTAGILLLVHLVARYIFLL